MTYKEWSVTWHRGEWCSLPGLRMKMVSPVTSDAGSPTTSQRPWRLMMSYTVAALHQDEPGQMTWQEYPPPWLRLADCIASVIVSLKTLTYLTALFVLFWQWNNQRCWRPVFWEKKCTPRFNHSYARLRATWLEDFLTLLWPGFFTALAPSRVV